MSDDRKPHWPWIVALLVGLPVLYVASFGPACWLNYQDLISANAMRVAYLPLHWLWESDRSGAIRNLVGTYAGTGVPRDTLLLWHSDRGPVWIYPPQ